MPWQSHGRTSEEPSARILVVEASYEVRMLIADLLTADGYQMKSVARMADALTLLEESEYDLILSDGAALYWEITRRWPHLVSRVICVTGERFSTRDHTALTADAVPIVQKPFTPAVLREVVKQKLARDR